MVGRYILTRGPSQDRNALDRVLRSQPYEPECGARRLQHTVLRVSSPRIFQTVESIGGVVHLLPVDFVELTPNSVIPKSILHVIILEKFEWNASYRFERSLYS